MHTHATLPSLVHVAGQRTYSTHERVQHRQKTIGNRQTAKQMTVAGRNQCALIS